MLDSQINKGKDYNVKTVITLIIYTGKSIRDLEHFEHRFELIDSDYLIKLKDGPIEDVYKRQCVTRDVRMLFKIENS